MDEFSNTTLTKNISHVLCLFLCPVVIICLRRYNKLDLHRFKEFLVIVTQKHDQKKRKLISGKYYYLRKKRTRKYPSLFFFFQRLDIYFPIDVLVLPQEQLPWITSLYTRNVSPLPTSPCTRKCMYPLSQQSGVRQKYQRTNKIFKTTKQSNNNVFIFF